MMRTRAQTLSVITLLLALISWRGIASEKTAAAAFAQFWAAHTSQDAAKAADALMPSMATSAISLLLIVFIFLPPESLAAFLLVPLYSHLATGVPSLPLT